MIKPPEQTAKDLVLEVDNIINPNKENKVNKGNWDYEKARELALFFVRKLLENNLLEPQPKRHKINGDEPNIIHLEYWQEVNHHIVKSLDYLDFNSNIKAGQEAIELLKELRGFAPYCTDHRQRVDDILSKVSVDMEVSQNEA